MKLLLLIITTASLLLTSCATTRRDGCGTENYKRKFTATKIEKTPKGWLVTLRNAKHEKRYLGYYECVPDSIVIGKVICI